MSRCEKLGVFPLVPGSIGRYQLRHGSGPIALDAHFQSCAAPGPVLRRPAPRSGNPIRSRSSPGTVAPPSLGPGHSMGPPRPAPPHAPVLRQCLGFRSSRHRRRRRIRHPQLPSLPARTRSVRLLPEPSTAPSDLDRPERRNRQARPCPADDCRAHSRLGRLHRKPHLSPPPDRRTHQGFPPAPARSLARIACPMPRAGAEILVRRPNPPDRKPPLPRGAGPHHASCHLALPPLELLARTDGFSPMDALQC